ncbi:hypothetical protein PANI_CDS0027 [Maribacter phage Panino]
MKSSDFVGEYAIHKDYGLVFVDNSPKGSKKMVNITVKQRGKGWNEETQSYRKYFVGSFLQPDHSRSLQWGFTSKDEFGIEDKVHIDSLTIKF